ncbi:uncharacterized protein [Nicotiana sylvestris]|uniref:uncharacterized protein n=1 Tax=Nicotiana sylvestris TaxID=4096 RepID=UPI00388C88A4
MEENFHPVGRILYQFILQIEKLDMLRPIESKLPNLPPKNLDYSLSYAYCSGNSGHDTEKCWHLKNAIQELIDTNRIEVQIPEAPNINQNPLSTREETNMIEIVHKEGEPKKPSQFVVMIRSREVKPVKKSMVEGLVNKLIMTNGKPSVIVEKRSLSDVVAKQLLVINTKAVPWNYERVIVTYKGKEVKEEVNEAQGLTRSGRCFAPEELRKAKTSRDNPVLIKKAVTKEEAEEFLRKMKAQDYSIMEQLRKTPTHISLLSLLIHSDEHRRALMKILNEPHVPDKISVNHLEKIANKIFEVNRITFFDDKLPLEGTEHNKALYLMVKYEDYVVIRVLVDNGSNANICPLSTLNKLKVDDERIHKNNLCVRGFDGRGKDSVGDIVLKLTIGPVEFTMEFQEIVVHGEENFCAHSDAYVPFIKAKDDKGVWVYKVFETMPVEKVPEGKRIPTPKIASASVMVASEMLKNGFVPGKDLGASLQGIIQPVSLPENLGTFGLGFKPTVADVRRAKRLK